MRLNLLTTFLATLAMSSFSVAAPASLVGLEIPPLPADCTDQEGMLLGTADAFAYSRLLCAGREVIVLQRFIERRGKLAYWKVVDELRLPSGKHGQSALDVPLCRSTSHKDEAILAVGKWVRAKDGSFVAKNISRAWRFNLASEKIESIPTRGVFCEGENHD